LRVYPQTVTATAGWTWPEIEPGLRVAGFEARTREVAGAEEVLRDLDERRWRGAVARFAVERLARDMEEGIAGREL
jgi:hypothetical protein